jgi:hypothetical protein
VAKTWGVATLPSTFVLNRELKSRLMAEGEFAWDRIKPEELSQPVAHHEKTPSGKGGE